MEYKDYYEILGVDRNATEAQIKKAYRKLARKYHPDVSDSSDAEIRFKEAGEAYEVLKDPEKRAAYDQLGSSWKSGQGFRPPPDWSAGSDFSSGGYTTVDAAHFSDFFETFFGGARSSGYPSAAGPFARRGEDIDAKVTIDLEDTYRGTTRQFTLQSPEMTSDGGVTRRTRTLNVHIPKGIKQGQKIRLARQGGLGVGGEPGDLYLEVEIPRSIHEPVERGVELDL